jgi:CheY-like chemotaxis protein
MPKMNGLETLSKLKDDPKTAAIPVIMLTGIGDRAEIAKAKLMGACDYILKPFNSDALLESLKKHIS